MNFENTRVMNFQGAFRGLRNPLESWKRSDSQFGLGAAEHCEADFEVLQAWMEKEQVEDDNYQKQDEILHWLDKNGVLNYSDGNGEVFEFAFLGPKDLDLAQRMIKGGSSERKFLRQIFVSVDITAPLYWWKEADTYKIGTVANSTSTMHKLSSTPIDIKCFETDDFNEDLVLYPNNGQDPDYHIKDLVGDIIVYCETLRKKYVETKDKKYWKELIRWLPSSWLQKRTITFNYEILRNIYFWRRNHKLTEWHQFCQWIETLPYADELITYNFN